MHSRSALICSLIQILRIGKPHKLPIKSKVHFDEPAVELQEKILSSPPHVAHKSPLAELHKLRRSLGPRRNRMKHVHTPDALSAHQWAECTRDCFYFRKFRHAE